MSINAMAMSPTAFWTWFHGFAKRLPDSDPPDSLQNELLGQLHAVDQRIYFELCTSADEKELIITASGDVAAFPIVDALVEAATPLPGWTFIALKPPQGFAFTFRNGEIALKASELWFMPLRSKTDPKALGICLGVPDADFIIERQTVDAAYTILETGIGERLCATAIQFLEIDNLPADLTASNYLPIDRLAEYLEWHRRRNC